MLNETETDYLGQNSEMVELEKGLNTNAIRSKRVAPLVVLIFLGLMLICVLIGVLTPRNPIRSILSSAVFVPWGLTNLNQGDLGAALDDFNRAIALDPVNSAAYVERGITYRHLGDFEAALADYNRAIELSPMYAVAYNNRGLIYFHGSGNLESALDDFNAAINLGYNSAYLNRGTVYDKVGNVEAALADYSRAIELDPQSPLAYLNRGNIFSGLGDFESALVDYKQFLMLYPIDDELSAHVRDQIEELSSR